MSKVPAIRIRKLNEFPVKTKGKFILYWMTSFRRLSWNFALDRAIQWANELKKPLLIFEPLRSDYPWASERFHRFMVEGMREKEARLKGSAIRYYPYVEPSHGSGKGLFAALSKVASIVVTDDSSAFFIPEMLAKASKSVNVCMEAVDSNGLFPIHATERMFETAYSFRRSLQKDLPRHLLQTPTKNPLVRLQAKKAASIPRKIQAKWPLAEPVELLEKGGLSDLPIDFDVPSVSTLGGEKSAQKTLRTFLKQKLSHYTTDRNDASKNNSSGLSPFLHFGHISAHQIFDQLMKQEEWSPDQLSEKCNGRREGWWGVGKDAEAFLDELITWREIGLNRCTLQKDYDRYRTLPKWAKASLAKHASDPRPKKYSLQQFEHAETHDPLWNAAQMQLFRDGTIHNYLRMLWGKKILEWSSTPQRALKIMVELNNKYALDGRDPNSYSGIFGTLGRFDRPWGPERSIFGNIRYMSSDSTRRKMNVTEYIKMYSGLLESYVGLRPLTFSLLRMAFFWIGLQTFSRVLTQLSIQVLNSIFAESSEPSFQAVMILTRPAP